MADPDMLVPGSCYFRVMYVDSDLFIPIVTTLMFVEKLCEEGEEGWLFQEASAFASGKPQADYVLVAEDQLYEILEIPDLIATLNGLKHLHPLRNSPTNQEVILTDENRKTISRQVDRVMSRATGASSITMTTNYRDKGVSLQSRDGSLFLSMYLDCKEDPEEELRIRDLFRTEGLSPSQDYLSQHERVRMLAYALRLAPESVSILIGRVFLEGYKIRANERIKPHHGTWQ